MHELELLYRNMISQIKAIKESIYIIRKCNFKQFVESNLIEEVIYNSKKLVTWIRSAGDFKKNVQNMKQEDIRNYFT